MRNSEEIVDILVGRGSVTGKDRDARMYMGDILQMLLRPESEQTAQTIIREMRTDRAIYVMVVIQALLLAYPKWETIFKLLEEKKYEEAKNRDEFFQGVVIGSMEAVVYLARAGKLSEIAKKQYLNLLIEFFRSAGSICNKSLDMQLSGRLSNISGVICAFETMPAFFKEVAKHGVELCVREIVSELCIKRFILLPLSKKMEICSEY